MKRLTIARIKKLNEPGRYADGNCLFLRVAPAGKTGRCSKQWVQRMVVCGKRRDIGLGGWPLLSLEEARIKAFNNRKLARIDGGDPLAGKRKAKTPTFKEAAIKTHAANKGRWSTGTAKNWMRSLEHHAFPTLGEMRIDAISRQDVLRTLTQNEFWSVQPQTAKKIRQRVRMIFDWCVSHGICKDNVADGSLDAALPVVQKKSKNLRALPFAEVSDALATVDKAKTSDAVKLCIRFLVLTAVRSGEVLGARWSEIDLDKAEWRISGDRMKSGVEHRVPLCAQSVNVLEKAKALNDGSGYVFPSPKRPGFPLSPMSLTMLFRKVGLAEKGTLHGFRTAFRTWAAEETNTDRATAELCLAHRVGSAVEMAYSRSDLYRKRQVLMGRWAAYLDGVQPGKVVNFG